MKQRYFLLDGVDNKIVCAHRKKFPPMALNKYVVAEHGDPEEQRAKGVLKDTGYQQYLTWKKICGLTEMGDKCLTCPHCKTAVNHPLKGEQYKDIPHFWTKLKPFGDSDG
ncbi:MAG: hypothetical protein AAGM67_09830 [Bacteroidota bacterium]